MDNDRQTCRLWKMYEQHRNYISKLNLAKVFRQSRDFYDGNHYSGLDVNDIELPKVVFNVVRMITDNKTSNILSTPFKTIFTSNYDSYVAVNMFNEFDKFIWQELNHDLLNADLVMDGIIKGSFAIHYYWSEETLGKKGTYKGSLQAEVLNPLDIAVANPKEKFIQRQKWIMYPVVMEIGKVKQLCDEGVDKELIIPDDEQIEKDIKSHDDYIDNDSRKCTVLQRLFRIGGEVYKELAIKQTIISKARPLNPNLTIKLSEKAIKNEAVDSEPYEIDKELSRVGDSDLELTDYDDDKFYLYPIEFGTLTPSDNSMFGIGDVYSLIMPQKMLNIYFATIYKKSMDDVFPKWLAKEGALQQEITGVPNEQIVDHSTGSSWGIQKIEGSAYSNGQLQLGQTIVDFMKMASNSRDVLTGEAMGANMAATAIQALQAQAEKPIAQQRERFMFFLQRCAKIRMQYYKFYYEEQEFSYDKDEADYEYELEQNKYDGNKVSKTINSVFNAKEYKNVVFNTTVKVGRGTKYDAITANESFNNFMMNLGQNLDSDHIELWLAGQDDNIFPNKNKVRAIIRKQRESEKAMITQQLTQANATIEQQQLQIQQAKAYIEALNNEFTNKLGVANEKIKTTEENYVRANELIAKLSSIVNTKTMKPTTQGTA